MRNIARGSRLVVTGIALIVVSVGCLIVSAVAFGSGSVSVDAMGAMAATPAPGAGIVWWGLGALVAVVGLGLFALGLRRKK